MVNNFLRDLEIYGKKKTPGLPRKLTPGGEQLLLWEAGKRNYSASELCDRLDLPVSVTNLKH